MSAINRSSSENPIPTFESLSLKTDDKKSPQSITQKVAEKVFENDSDGELSDSDEEIPFFSRIKSGSIKAKHMTIQTKEEDGSIHNIKGSELILIAHEIVKYIYQGHPHSEIDQKDIIKDRVLTIKNSGGWISSLGHWKLMIPTTEIRVHSPSLTKVKIDGHSFSIKGGFRIHICSDNEKSQFDITRTDLTYPQILAKIEKFKIKLTESDSDLAKKQLKLLSNEKAFDDDKILTFFHFLNALMFGIESSGLNAGILTSLLTLDLIATGKSTYKKAFRANKEGGIYPFTNLIRGNKGSFKNRKPIINEAHLSMKKYREDLCRSPIAVKEAMLIKYWLKYNDIIKKDDSYDESMDKIVYALLQLMSQYFPIA